MRISAPAHGLGRGPLRPLAARYASGDGGQCCLPVQLPRLAQQVHVDLQRRPRTVMAQLLAGLRDRFPECYQQAGAEMAQVIEPVAPEPGLDGHADAARAPSACIMFCADVAAGTLADRGMPVPALPGPVIETPAAQCDWRSTSAGLLSQPAWRWKAPLPGSPRHI